jgi:hypothetical protein
MPVGTVPTTPRRLAQHSHVLSASAEPTLPDPVPVYGAGTGTTGRGSQGGSRNRWRSEPSWPCCRTCRGREAGSLSLRRIRHTGRDSPWQPRRSTRKEVT